jgi:hypothetical protein
MREPAAVFYLRKVLPITAEDLIEMEQVGWGCMSLDQARELATMLRAGLTVAADCPRGCCPPARYALR